MVSPTRALNPASQPWGRGVEKQTSANEETLKRATLTLNQADKTLQGALTRLNKFLSTIDEQQKYLLALKTQYVETHTEGVLLATNPWGTADAVQGATWNGADSIRPKIKVNSPTGLVKITIAAHGKSALVTYSIAGVRPRLDALATTSDMYAQLILPASESGTGQRDWVQKIPANTDVTIVVESVGMDSGGFVASPSLTVQVIP